MYPTMYPTSENPFSYESTPSGTDESQFMKDSAGKTRNSNSMVRVTCVVLVLLLPGILALAIIASTARMGTDHDRGDAVKDKIDSKGYGGGPATKVIPPPHYISKPDSGTTQPRKSSTALRPEGPRIARDYIKAALNWSYSPCNHFYSFVCRWFLSTGHGTTFSRMASQAEAKIRHMLATMHVRPRLQPATEKAAGLFRACVSLASNPKRSEMEPVKALLSQLGLDVSNIDHDPNFDLPHRLVYLSCVYGYPSYIRFGIYWSFNHGKAFDCGLNKEDENWMKDQHRKTRANLLKFYRSYLALYDSAIDSAALAERIVLLEVVVKDFFEDQRKRGWSLRGTPLGQLGSYTKGYVSEKEWPRLVAQATSNMFNETSRVLVWENLTALVELFMDGKHMKIDDARLLLGWSVLHRILPSASGKLMSEEALRHYRHRHDRVSFMCYWRVVNVMPLAVSLEYFKEFIPPAAMASARRVVTNVMRVLQDKINTTDWIRGPLWCAMRTKFKALFLILGYPDGLSSEYLIEKLFEEFPDVVGENFTAAFLAARRQSTLNNFRKNFKVNINTAASGAHYHPNTHEIYFAAVLIQPPVFIHGAPAAYNYGGLGQAAGHELSHPFDAEDITYDACGSNVPFGQTTTMKEFTGKVLCLRNSYYESETEQRGRSMSPSIDSEGLVDFMGVLIAYEAYKRLPERERTAVIPDMDFTPDQLFFLSYCLKWCTSERGTKRGPNSIYWTARSRCMVPLRNMPEFAQAFSCKKGDRMNPGNRCGFW